MKPFTKKTVLAAAIIAASLCLCSCGEDIAKTAQNAASEEISKAKDDNIAADVTVSGDVENLSQDTETEKPEAGTVSEDDTPEVIEPMELKDEWKADQVFVLADPAPWDLEELRQVVDVNDPRSVAAYWVWAVTRLTDDYDDGMEMMKYLFADIEVFGSGYTEGGLSGKAGWDSYFDERLSSTDYSWLPRAYFEGCTKENGYSPERPLSIELYYNDTNTETINSQTLDTLGRLNIVFWVQSYAGGNQVNIELSRFDGTNRWYVTNGTASSALFYQQPEGNGTKDIANDDSTQAEHDALYR